MITAYLIFVTVSLFAAIAVQVVASVATTRAFA